MLSKIQNGKIFNYWFKIQTTKDLLVRSDPLKSVGDGMKRLFGLESDIGLGVCFDGVKSRDELGDDNLGIIKLSYFVKQGKLEQYDLNKKQLSLILYSEG